MCKNYIQLCASGDALSIRPSSSHGEQKVKYLQMLMDYVVMEMDSVAYLITSFFCYVSYYFLILWSSCNIQ